MMGVVWSVASANFDQAIDSQEMLRTSVNLMCLSTMSPMVRQSLKALLWW